MLISTIKRVQIACRVLFSDLGGPIHLPIKNQNPFKALTELHVACLEKAFNHIKSLVVIGSVSPRCRLQGTCQASLYFACLSIVQSCKLYKHI